MSKLAGLLALAAALVTAGCGAPYLTSYYGTVWADVTAERGDYASYQVTIDSISLTRNDGVIVTAAYVPEIVDLAQITNYAELWSSGSIPDGIYTSATITLDYTYAAISVFANGVPQAATVVDAVTGGQATTYSVTVNFDPSYQPNITPTFASTSAVLLNLNFDLAASGVIDTSTHPATVRVRPYMTIAEQSPDTKLIRVRGPLINSSTDVNTFTVSIRPFYDEASNIGNLTLFTQTNTVWTLNGTPYLGSAGLAAVAVLSAGTTISAAWTTFQTDYNALNGATAGRFNAVYVVAGSTLEDFYTQGLTGDVIARSGDTVTLLDSTEVNTIYNFFNYVNAPTQLILGPNTLVTADDNTTLTHLGPADVAVGQHIAARGILTTLPDQTVQLDATGDVSTNTGSVRLLNTEVWGSLTSASGAMLTMNAQAIDHLPIGDFNFTGNGAGVSPAAFQVSTGTLGLPAGVVAGDPIWVNGYTAPFGAAPPDFSAVAVNGEASVQVAGGQVGGGAPTAPGTRGCGAASQVCDPARLQVIWSSSSTPFVGLSNAGFSLDLTNATTAVITIGPEVIALASAPTVTFQPTTLTPTSIFAPRFTVGNPVTATVTPTVFTPTTALESFSAFPAWVTQVGQSLSASVPALQLTASGIYDRASSTFTATSIDLVL